MGKFKDLTGKRFGRLVVLGLDHVEDKNNRKRKFWTCKCDCGSEKVIRTDALTGGGTTSCGCFARERAAELLTSHGEADTRLYRIWHDMKERCSNSKMKTCSRYKARGIKVCDEWKNSYERFSFWAKNNGYEDHLSIDRIDNNGNYCPENCRWVTNKQNSRNRECNIIVEYKGNSITLSEASELTNIKYETLRVRYHKGDRGEYLFRTIDERFSRNYKKEE
jgi:hypothetical protein